MEESSWASQNLKQVLALYKEKKKNKKTLLSQISDIFSVIILNLYYFNTFAAIVDLSRFNNLCLRLLKSSDDNNE
jgi:hypothetical protein